MNAKRLQRFLQALLLGTCLSIFALTSAYAADAVKVTADNYVRAESDFQMKGYIDSYKCFGKFHHNRKPYDVENQITIRGNRDTLYSFGVWDLTSPVTITLPNTEGRYQSLMIVSQDHSIWGLYGPKKGTLTEDEVGTRYVLLTIRTFMDPNDKQDLKEVHRLQDAVGVKQAGKFHSYVEAEFFSFGTNDLTQMTFGYSRDDVGTFVPEYIDQNILEEDPFAVLDQSEA
mgnify:CR=1 FL=1